MTKICLDCRKEFDENMLFCLECGKPLPNKEELTDKIVNCNFQFQCPLDWNKLKLGESEDIRFCPNCSKNVYFAHTQTEVDNFALEGKCVAFHPYEGITFDDPRHLPPPLMGVIVYPEIMPELAEKSPEKPKEPEKSWWQFWK